MFDNDAVRGALDNKGWEWPLKLFEEVDSTNLEAKRLIRRGKLLEGGIVLADKQTAGKGRLGRLWVAAPGKDLTFTLVFRNELNRVDIPKTGLAAALGICHALEKDFGINARLKWPNDILIDREKISGILSEYVTPEEILLIGIGINVNSEEKDWDFSTITKPTSLKIAAGKELDRGQLLASCAVGVRDFLAFAKWEYFPTFQALYETKAFYEHMRVAVYVDAYSSNEPDEKENNNDVVQRVIEGTALGIDRYGALRVKDDDGQDHIVRAGDMVLPTG
jgi:BirA family biotin operon repressor/biotin-[acetyl-CoA-carboxylase] ligase